MGNISQWRFGRHSKCAASAEWDHHKNETNRNKIVHFLWVNAEWSSPKFESRWNEIPIARSQSDRSRFILSLRMKTYLISLKIKCRITPNICSGNKFSWRKKEKILSYSACNSHHLCFCILLIFHGARHASFSLYNFRIYAPLAYSFLN